MYARPLLLNTCGKSNKEPIYESMVLGLLLVFLLWVVAIERETLLDCS